MAGYKTYFVAGAMVILAGLHSQGYLNDSTYQSLQGLLTGGGLAFLRMSIAQQR